VAEIPLAEIKRHPNADDVYYLEERERPGEFMPIFEDEHGTYIMNSRDLRAVEHVQRLTEIGVDCLKIEGRTKSHYYTARTTQVYRRAIDDAVAQRPFDPGLLAELENLANRGYTDGFLQRHASQDLQNYRQGSSSSAKSQFVAEVAGIDPTTGLSRLRVKNKFRVGDEMELLSPGGNRRFRLETMFDKQGRPLLEVPGGGWEVSVRLPEGAGEMALVTRFSP
jgi:putative protease